MPVVNPGIRRYIGSAIQRLFNSASFSAPLTHSLTLERGTGSPTYTNATTGTFQDNEGVLRTAIAGEARFTGARRVENLIRLGAAQSSTLAIGASVTMTLPAGTYIFSQGVSVGTATFSGTGGATGTLAASASVRTSVVKTITAGTLIVTGSVAILTDIQVENITGRTDQTTPSEYVSVGVLSAPYHGAGVDGVAYFDTDLSGNPIAASTLKGYLAEPAATNMCLQSSNLAGAGWTPASVSVSVNAAIGIDGMLSADLFYPTSTGTFRGPYQPITGTTESWTQYVIAAPAGFNWLGLLNFYGSGGSGAVWFDLVNGVIGSNTVSAPSAVTPYIKPRGNGFYECGFTGTGAVSQFIQFFCADSNGSSTATASGTNGLYVAGCQVELGSSATSYIPTTTVAVARNADVESVPTSGNIIAASGWISLTYTPTHAPSGTVFLWGTYVDASNYTAILHDATNLIFRKRIAGTNYDATIANAFVSGTTYKMAATWGASGTGIALNGTLGTGHANTTAAQIGTAMQTGADGNGANQPGMSLGNERIGQRQLSSSELQAITR